MSESNPQSSSIESPEALDQDLARTRAEIAELLSEVPPALRNTANVRTLSIGEEALKEYFAKKK